MINSSNALSGIPLFEVISNSFSGTASIKHWFTIGTQVYGIYQTSTNGLGVRNYFQDPVKVGYIEMRKGPNNNAVIGTDQGVNSFDFVMEPCTPGCDPITPLSLSNLGVRVRPKLITESFQLLTNPGADKILTSDAYGNGIWTVPSSLGLSLWADNGIGGIWTSFSKVGIGTRGPSEALEICHSNEKGGLVLNQISMDPSISTTEIRFERSGEEKFAIGYWVNSRRPSFFIWNHIYQRTALYIGEDNKTGIDTEWPNAKLDVNGDFKAAAVGIGINPPPPSDSYKLWVEGGIAAREVRVTSATFPDFVFKQNYSLLPIDKLEEYISTEKHLPDMPSQSDIEKDGGVKIGQLQLKLLQKIEEQSLYIISLQKQINELRECIITKEGK
ncbi:hypothetical protein D4R99_01635 [bacterium]|nr:MAG: hypothetical protein D4R99_01635 [bacterium]